MVSEGQVWKYTSSKLYRISKVNRDGSSCVLIDVAANKIASSTYRTYHFSKTHLWTPLSIENE
jgi:hypothetical protein